LKDDRTYGSSVVLLPASTEEVQAVVRLKAAGHDDLLISIPDLGWGSVIGNSLDDGISYLSYGQDFMAPCGMEVVLAAGGVLPDAQIQEIADRTGLGRWGMRAAVWGDAPVADHHVEKVRRAWSAIDGARVLHERTFGAEDWDEIVTTPDR
jgi:hypothetical protein